MDDPLRTARVAFVSPAPITGQGVHVVAAAQLLQRFRITHKTTLPLQPASSPVFLVNVGHSCDSDAWHSMCQCHTLVVTGNLSCSCRRDQWRCLMNQVMRRSVCCLLSTLLLWSCVGCTKAVHESSSDGSVQSGSENDDAAEQAYKAFTVGSGPCRRR